ncbi:fungal hydrophobin [Cubamyces sp. BRFM 1775]|nr:fungal hydrophobin [Cubamyces sp. BRFM 1775]
MVARITAAFVALVAATTATASAIPRTDGSSACNTGSLSCCDSVVSPQNAEAQMMAALLGLDLGDVTGLVGLNCNPITVIGAGLGASCKQQPVCCENNSVGGLINIGCAPVSL